MLTCSMMRYLSLLLLGICPCGVSVDMWSSVSEVVVLPCVDRVVAVMLVLLFVLRMCVARVTEILVWWMDEVCLW